MAVSACGAPVGGSARESKTAPAKKNAPRSGIAATNADATRARTRPVLPGNDLALAGSARVGNGQKKVRCDFVPTRTMPNATPLAAMTVVKLADATRSLVSGWLRKPKRGRTASTVGST